MLLKKNKLVVIATTVVILSLTILAILINSKFKEAARGLQAKENQITAQKNQIEKFEEELKEAQKELRECRKREAELKIELNEDLRLSIEELREKYPIDWFEERFGLIKLVNSGWCDGGVDANGITYTKDGERLDCQVDRRLNTLNTNEIKSILAHYSNLGQNVNEVLTVILKSIYEEKEKSPYYEIKDFVLYKEILMNADRVFCKDLVSIPDDLSYYREMILYYSEHSRIFRCLNSNLADDEEVFYKTMYKRDDWDRRSYKKYFSERIQNIYAQEGLEGIKKRIDKNNI